VSVGVDREGPGRALPEAHVAALGFCRDGFGSRLSAERERVESFGGLEKGLWVAGP
jgi:hypothetical protein